jgi:hypothetical protein
MRNCTIAAFLLLLAASIGGAAQTMSDSSNASLKIRSVNTDFAVSDLSNAAWERADRISVGKYWSGARTAVDRQFSARLLWSRSALYIRFEANQAEPLIVNDRPDLTKKTMGLWDRDVCEIFVAPDRAEPRKYFEFEVAPTGEWLDVAIDLTGGTRVSDWKYASGMESYARVEPGKVVMAMKIPWAAFGKTPAAGSVWLGNLLRCVGKDPDRGYLGWQPTLTKEPAFHVPERFGEFRFVD